MGGCRADEGALNKLSTSWQYCEVSPSAPTAHSRLAAGAALLLVVLALHLWLLGFAPAGWGPAAPSSATRLGAAALQVRAIEMPANLPVSALASQAPAGAATAIARPAVQPVVQPAVRPTQAKPAPQPSSAAAAQPAAEVTSTQAALAAPANTPTPVDIPVYATQPAPATTLQYRLQRGLAVGTATLDWQPLDGGGYRLSLSTQAFGIDATSWLSRGQLDAAGLAPDRYSEARRGRELRASNFNRDPANPLAGTLSFSAQSTQHPLAPGMQDRLSWMLQLPAVLQANPALAVVGAQVTLLVVGTRGAPEPWVFVVQAADRAGLVYLLREPRRPYDLRAHVWLDPQRHYLPASIQLLVQATGEGHTFDLESANPP